MPITEKYEKYADGKWHKDEAWRGGNIYVIDGKIYEKYNDSLMPLNIDFNSSSCHACWKLIEEITEFKRITGNKNLYYSPVLKITLHRQDYSNGTCFYSLIRDGEKYAAVDECGTLEKILEVLRRYNRIDDKYRMLPQINDIISALIYIHEDDIDERAKIERWVEFLGKKFSQKHINDIYNRWLACKKVKSRKRRSFDTLEEFLYDEELKIALKVPTSAYQKAFKQTAREVGITYNVNTHSTRKTFGYWSRQIHPHDLDSLEILRQIYVHATQAMTADYIGITAEKKKKYFHDFGEMMKRVANGEEYVIDNTPVISIKTSDLRDILTLAITDKSGETPLDMMNKLMGMVEECRVI